jgi:ribonuclease H2 subunit C
MPTDRILPSQQADKDQDVEILESGPEESVKILETQGTFDEMIVWQHEFLPAADDTFIKGVEEWVRFAETVCVFHGLRFLDSRS